MTPGEFAQIQEELRVHQLQAAAEFCARRGLPFDADAFDRQATLKSDERAQELLFFGAAAFPREEPRVEPIA